MWIPTPFYERIPQFMLGSGVIFILSALYLGFDYQMSYVYFGVGIACLFWGVVVYALRQKFRAGRQKDPAADSEEAEQA